MIFVPGRAGLPAKVDTDTDLRHRAACPFCPGSEETPGPYEVKVVPSRYPAVHTDRADADQATHGLHSVFLYTTDHDGRLVDQSVARITGLLMAIGAETAQFLEDPSIEGVFGFETSGDHFGPTVDHPHGQLIGFAFTPRRLTLSERLCFICGTTTPRDPPPEVVWSTGSARVFVPPFARLPFEMWIVPREHVGYLADLGERQIGDLARSLLAGLRACLDDQGRMPQYMLTIMQAPRSRSLEHHLRIELVPLHRPIGGMKRPGGVELGAGIFLNPLLSEDAATILRARLVEVGP